MRASFAPWLLLLVKAAAGAPTLSASGISQTVLATTTLDEIVGWANSAASNVTIFLQANSQHQSENTVSLNQQLLINNPVKIAFEGKGFYYNGTRSVLNDTDVKSNLTVFFSCWPAIVFTHTTPSFAVSNNKELSLKGITLKSSTGLVVQVGTGGKAVAENCTFSNNQAGLISAAASGDITLQNCTIGYNTNSAGANIELTNSVLTVGDSVLVNNSGATQGGVLKATGSVIAFSRSTLVHNRVIADSGNGGAISVSSSTVSISKSSLDSNRAGYGGAICAKDGSTVTLTDSSFAYNWIGQYGSNVSHGAGGAISLENSQLSSSETSFFFNKAESGGHGGAIAALVSSVNLSWSAFGGNFVTPPGKGGAVYITSGTYRVTGKTDFHAKSIIHSDAIPKDLKSKMVGERAKAAKAGAKVWVQPGQTPSSGVGAPSPPGGYGMYGRRLLYAPKHGLGKKLVKSSVHDTMRYYRVSRDGEIPDAQTPLGEGKFVHAENVNFQTPSLECAGCTVSQ